MPNIGPMELAIVLIIALVIVGPKKLPDLGRSAGKGLREFKDSVTGDKDDEKPQITARQGRRARARSRARSSPTARRLSCATEGEEGRPRRRAQRRRSPRRAAHADHRLRGACSSSRSASASGRTICLLAVANGPLPDGREPITFGVTEPFFTTMKLSFYAGILLALPVLLYQAYAYVLPAFKPTSGAWCCRCC